MPVEILLILIVPAFPDPLAPTSTDSNSSIAMEVENMGDMTAGVQGRVEELWDAATWLEVVGENQRLYAKNLFTWVEVAKKARSPGQAKNKITKTSYLTGLSHEFHTHSNLCLEIRIRGHVRAGVWSGVWDQMPAHLTTAHGGKMMGQPGLSFPYIFTCGNSVQSLASQCLAQATWAAPLWW